MRFLTALSAFFLPITFIVGFYGMNFKYIPELEWRYGYLYVLGLNAIAIVIVFIIFYRKKLL
jgi:magnesium transporter